MKPRSIVQAICILVFAYSLGSACLNFEVRTPTLGSPLDGIQWRPGITTPMADVVISGDNGSEPVEPDAIGANDSVVLDMDKLIENVKKGMRYRIDIPDPWQASGCTTQDVPNHVGWWGDWWNSQPGAPPYISSALWMQMKCWYLQMFLFPDEFQKSVRLPDLINYYIELGTPARRAAEISTAIDGMPAGYGYPEDQNVYFKRMLDEVIKNIDPPVNNMPMAVQGKTARETMFNEAIVKLIGTTCPYDIDVRWGESLFAMGPEVVPYLCKAALEHPHPVVRRNATYMLRQYEQPEATKTLRKILTTTKDKTSRNRALSALIKRKDTTIVHFLMKALKDEDDYFFQHYAVFALGGLGHGNVEAMKAIFDWAKPSLKGNKFGDAGDVMYSASVALTRLAETHPKGALDFFHKVQKKFGGGFSPVYQASLLGRVVAGDKGAMADMRKRTKSNLIPWFAKSVQLLAVETFAKIGDKIRKNTLHSIMTDKSLSESVRYYAISMYHFKPNEKKGLIQILEDKSMPEAVRSVAMVRLFEFDAPAAKKAARAVLENFMGHNNPESFVTSNEIVIALQLLGPTLDLSVKEVGRIMSQSLRMAKQEKAIGSRESIDGRVGVQIVAPIFPTAVIEMGRLARDPAAFEALRELILDSSMPGRWEAARALGIQGGEKAVRLLVKALHDPKDAYLRYHAAETLAGLTGETCDINWITGKKSEIAKGIQFWKTWVVDNLGAVPGAGNNDPSEGDD